MLGFSGALLVHSCSPVFWPLAAKSAPTPGPSPPSSNPVPSPPPASLLTVSGIVLEHTPEGSRPLAGLRLQVITSGSPWDYEEPALVTSDAGGRFHFLASPGSLVALVIPDGAGYHAPCPSGFDTIGGNVAMELHVVADTILSSTGRPRSMPYTPLWVSGTVIDSEAVGRRSTDCRCDGRACREVGASLKSVTLSDAAGNFLLCTNPPGVGTDQLMWLTARKQGYRTDSRTVVMGQDDQLSLGLVRN